MVNRFSAMMIKLPFYKLFICFVIASCTPKLQVKNMDKTEEEFNTKIINLKSRVSIFLAEVLQDYDLARFVNIDQKEGDNYLKEIRLG